MNVPVRSLLFAWVVGIVLLVSPHSATGQTLPPAPDLTTIRAQFAAKDAEIARLRQQLAALNARLTLAEALLARKDAAPPHTSGKPPASPAERWDTEYTFTGERISGARPDMTFWAPNDPQHEHKASRPMPDGYTAEDYARGFESICQQLGVTAKRIGASVFIVGAMPGNSPDYMTTKNLHP